MAIELALGIESRPHLRHFLGAASTTIASRVDDSVSHSASATSNSVAHYLETKRIEGVREIGGIVALRKPPLPAEELCTAHIVYDHCSRPRLLGNVAMMAHCDDRQTSFR